jgi:hypothetical protein
VVPIPTLAKTLASSLLPALDGQPDPAPTVYTAAICTDADLVSCLSGIAQITRQQGFTLHPETLYRAGGRSASYHVDHQSRGVALAVDCNPERRTVSLAVTGPDPEETWEVFHALEEALFGGC